MSRKKGECPTTAPAASIPSIRQAYDLQGSDDFYQSHGAAYRNPHEPIIRSLLADAHATWRLDLSRTLDLCCGSGEVTVAIRELGAGYIEACDPYTQQAYLSRTALVAEPWSFADVASGVLRGRQYSLIICSFALHLCERSRLPDVARELAMASPRLLILTPHKRPELREAWGWKSAGEILRQRVRARLYDSAIRAGL